jgi:hypothetical protein
MLSTTNMIYLVYNGNVISNTAPFTWGNGDYVEFNLLLKGLRLMPFSSTIIIRNANNF